MAKKQNKKQNKTNKKKTYFNWKISVSDCLNVWRGLKSIRLTKKSKTPSQKFQTKETPARNPLMLVLPPLYNYTQEKRNKMVARIF